MFNFLKRQRFRISIGLIFLTFILMLLGQAEEGRVENWFVKSLQTIAYPFQATTNFFIEGTGSLWNHYIWVIGVEEENKKLQKELALYKENHAKTQELRLAYDRLLGILNFERTNADEKIYAEVIGETQDSFSKLLIINRGANHGIKKNFAVVTPIGIVGKIQSVTPFQSVVQLVTDSRSHFPALVQRTRLKAMVKGNLDGSLSISNFPRRMSIKIGDMVVTSGLAGIFPKGFPIGRISNIEKKEFGLFQRVTLKPVVSINQVEEVAIILLSLGNIHQPLFTEEE